MAVKTSKLVRYLDQLYPFALAEKWDNVGLIFGSPNEQLERVLMALDISIEVAEEARDKGCGAIITHHPPIFQPIKRIDLTTTQGELIGFCLKHDIASIALHTNLDSALGGLNDTVCDLLGLTKTKPLLDSGKERLAKLVVFVPNDHADRVRNAMFDAGAGEVGEYDRCSFNLRGTGTFRGGENTNPTIGEPGSLEEVEEVRVEVLLQRERCGQVYSAMVQAHPYEEVAYDFIPLMNRERGTGLGRIGVLPTAVTMREFADQVAKLDMMVLRTIGDPDRKVRKVALCTGAGGDFTSSAASAGADVYLTAEVKHHHALDAQRRGLCVVETDHYTLERVHWARLKPLLEQHFSGDIEALVSERERSCWTRYP